MRRTSGNPVGTHRTGLGPRVVRAGAVDDDERDVLDCECGDRGQVDRRRVDVARDSSQLRRERSNLVDRLGRVEVARVNRTVGRTDSVADPRREVGRATGNVRVADEGEVGGHT